MPISFPEHARSQVKGYAQPQPANRHARGTRMKACMMLNINLDYDWIMAKVLITKRQSSLMGENKFVIAIWAGVSSFPARTKRLLRRLGYMESMY